MKLSEKQIEVIKKMQQYPNAIIMDDGWMTGGHGIKFDLRTVRSLESKRIIVHGKLNYQKPD